MFYGSLKRHLDACKNIYVRLMSEVCVVSGHPVITAYVVLLDSLLLLKRYSTYALQCIQAY